MILHDVSIYGEEGHRDIRIRNGIIESVEENSIQTADKDELRFDLNAAIVLPGFINSHEHLDFNCFPALGNKFYTNYTAWGPDIQSAHAEVIKKVQSIPHELRIQWGIYKNLLNGFTTVVNHGETVAVENDLIDIFQETESLHSPAFEKNWKWKLNNLFKLSIPVSMHMGEGTDDAAGKEIDEVIKANKIGREIVAIHGVAMSEKQAAAIDGLVWCPASNFFFLGKTAPVGDLKKNTTVVFGTDSTLTSPWNCWEHFRQAMSSGMTDEKELVGMLTSAPAGLWRMNDRGKIINGKKADIIALKKNKNIFDGNPEDILLVIQGGDLRLIDERLGRQPLGFSRVGSNANVKYIQGDLVGLAKNIKTYYPEINLAFSIEHE
jgi:cytosine/adenosine deaminase-related metal-dependent hydrolase